MEGKEAIVGRIISDAEARAAQAKQEAAARADAMKEEAAARARTLLEEGAAALEKEAGERIARRETGAQLDCGKPMLAAKRGVIDAVFARAEAIACALPKEEYLAVLGQLLGAYAEEGDEVVLAAGAPVGEKELVSLAVFSAKKLRFAGKTGEFSGGLRLVNARCEQDLSFGALLEEGRAEHEREIAAAFPAEI